MFEVEERSSAFLDEIDEQQIIDEISKGNIDDFVMGDGLL